MQGDGLGCNDTPSLGLGGPDAGRGRSVVQTTKQTDIQTTTVDVRDSSMRTAYAQTGESDTHAQPMEERAKLAANFLEDTKHLSRDISAMCSQVHHVRREIQKAWLDSGMPVEFVVKKRVQRTPGIRATRKLTLEQRDGEAWLVNRCDVCVCMCMHRDVGAT